jgi:hypothetical protein
VMICPLLGSPFPKTEVVGKEVRKTGPADVVTKKWRWMGGDSGWNLIEQATKRVYIAYRSTALGPALPAQHISDSL